MTDRDITGDIRRVGLNRLPALLGISNESLKELAERVRQFDQAQSDETRQRKALEKIATAINNSTLNESNGDNFRRKQLREREVAALELMAAAQAYPYEELRDTYTFNRIVSRLERLDRKPETREEETRNV